MGHAAAPAAIAVLLAHLAFVLFVVFGGLLALRWPRATWLHLPAAAWGVFVELSGRRCPLTLLENLLRLRAGVAGYREGFIEHYLLGMLYPAGLARPTQFALAAAVLLINSGIYGWLWRRSRATGL